MEKENQKKASLILGIYFIFSLMFLISALPNVLGEEISGDDVTAVVFDGASTSAAATGSFFEKRYELWKDGVKSLQDPSKRSLIGETLKWLFLLIIMGISYSGLSAIDIPDNAFLRILLSIVVGFLATFLITTEELITALESYSALGIAISVFLPLIILIGITIMLASKAEPAGIYAQKILWLIYAAYLFLRTAILLLLKMFGSFSGGGFHLPGGLSWMASFITQGTIKTLESYDTTMLIVLFVVSIAVFVIFVVKNNFVIEWLNSERRKSEIAAQKARMKRSHSYDAARSEAIQEQEE
jgi:hypothetical protein